MNFRPITIKKINEDIVKFYPELIDKIKITTEQVIIWQPKQYILNRKDYYYPEWNSFINTLNSIFGGIK